MLITTPLVFFPTVLTGDRLSESHRVIDLANTHEGLYATVGCHPCRANEAVNYPSGGIDGYMHDLSKVIRENLGGRQGNGKVVAVGECGLGTCKGRPAWSKYWYRHCY
jgi:TatD DNase family protein